MTVALGNFVVTFDVEDAVDVHDWWLGGPKLAQVGYKLAPSWPKLVPR